VMARFVELILFGFLLWLAYEGVKARVRAFFSGTPPATRAPRSSGQPAETLVRCAECGTHVVKARAVSVRDRPELYCSDRCQTAAARRNRS
jgi:predicted SprT family Zn-dependent metalloprotease